MYDKYAAGAQGYRYQTVLMRSDLRIGKSALYLTCTSQLYLRRITLKGTIQLLMNKSRLFLKIYKVTLLFEHIWYI